MNNIFTIVAPLLSPHTLFSNSQNYIWLNKSKAKLRQWMFHFSPNTEDCKAGGQRELITNWNDRHERPNSSVVSLSKVDSQRSWTQPQCNDPPNKGYYHSETCSLKRKIHKKKILEERQASKITIKHWGPTYSTRKTEMLLPWFKATYSVKSPVHSMRASLLRVEQRR